MSARSNSYPLGAMFAGSLVLSWTLMTLSVALTIWSDRHAPAARLASWVSLWVFTGPRAHVVGTHPSSQHRAVRRERWCRRSVHSRIGADAVSRGSFGEHGAAQRLCARLRSLICSQPSTIGGCACEGDL